MTGNQWRAIADRHLERFRDQWNPTHAAVERWLLQQALIAEGRGTSEQFALLRALDHPEWQPSQARPTSDHHLETPND